MKKKLVIGLGFVVLIVVFFVLNSSSTDSVVTENIKEFNVEAFRFGYGPDVIRVSQGDSVKIVVNNTEGLHGIRIPEFGVAGMESVEFVADKKGEFVWYCNNYCGEGHTAMQGKLIVE